MEVLLDISCFPYSVLVHLSLDKNKSFHSMISIPCYLPDRMTVGTGTKALPLPIITVSESWVRAKIARELVTVAINEMNWPQS